MSPVVTLLMSVVAAIFFMAATGFMKMLSDQPVWISLPAVFVLLGLGALAEMEVLRSTRMGHVAVLMLAVELVLSFAVACVVLGERYSAQEIAGVAVIVVGMALLSLGGLPGANRDDRELPGKEPRLTARDAGAARPEPYAFSTSTPGSTLPSIHSRNAPPAVEI